MRFPPVENILVLCRQAKVLALARAQNADLANIFTEAFGKKAQNKSPTRRSSQSHQTRKIAAQTTSSFSPASMRRIQEQAGKSHPKPSRSSGNSGVRASANTANKRTVGSVASSTLKAAGSAVNSVGRRIQSAAKSMASKVATGGRRPRVDKPSIDDEIELLRRAWARFRCVRQEGFFQSLSFLRHK